MKIASSSKKNATKQFFSRVVRVVFCGAVFVCGSVAKTVVHSWLNIL
jgi:hypothetical protein